MTFFSNFSCVCFFFLLYKPRTILYVLGSGENAKQWAAVTIHSGWIREAPHLCNHFPFSLSLFSIMACQGQEWGIASFPPSTRGKGGLWPHSAKQIFLSTIYASNAIQPFFHVYHSFQRNLKKNTHTHTHTHKLRMATVILTLKWRKANYL